MPVGVRPRKHPPVKPGDKFDRLEVLEVFREQRSNGYFREKARCRCSCGEISNPTTDRLKAGKTGSCKCLMRESVGNRFRTHGLTSHPGHISWRRMVERCLDPRHQSYSRYGGRGIGICDEWNPEVVGVDEALSNFTTWFDLQGDPTGRTLDREKNDRGYSPDNCRLATPGEQLRNTSRTLHLEMFGERKCARDWADDPRCKVSYETFRHRIHAGWEPNSALTTPPRTRNQCNQSS